MSPVDPWIEPTVCGVYLRFGTVIDEEINERCLELARIVNQHPAEGFGPAIPSYAAVLVLADPKHHSLTSVVHKLRENLQRVLQSRRTGPARRFRWHELPVVYGGEAGPDLEAVARELGLTVQEVIRIHSSASYRVYCQGFSPGFSFLGPLPEAIRVSRLNQPRLRVPAGSVGIAGAQTGVYPLPSPGGWRLIGRSTIPLYRPPSDFQEEAPLQLRPGDRVRFRPVEGSGIRVQASDVTQPSVQPQPSATGAWIEVIRPGLLSTIQDLGRTAWLPYGFSISGAMDRGAMRRANRLAGNHEGEACLEITAAGPHLRFHGKGKAALAGADLDAVCRGRSIRPGDVFEFIEGDELTFRSRRNGMRAYLAVTGGFRLPKLAGSLSTDLIANIGGIQGRALRAGDRIPLREAAGSDVSPENSTEGNGHQEGITEFEPLDGPSWTSGAEMYVRWLPGLEFSRLSPDQAAQFVVSAWEITADSNRMGLRLSGPRLKVAQGGTMLSEPLAPGAIQLPPSGQPIVLMSDCQTIGGYPRLGYVLDEDRDRLAQCIPGTRIRFLPASLLDVWKYA